MTDQKMADLPTNSQQASEDAHVAEQEAKADSKVTDHLQDFSLWNFVDKKKKLVERNFRGLLFVEFCR